MSSAYYPLGAKKYNNHLPQGGYKPWKGTGPFSLPVGMTATHIRPLTNNDPGNCFSPGFGLPRPLHHYRRGTVMRISDYDELLVSDPLVAYNLNRDVKSSYGSSLGGKNGGLVSHLMDSPGGYIIKNNNPTSTVDIDCRQCHGISIVDNTLPIPSLTETPEPNTETRELCCNEQRKAVKMTLPVKTMLSKKYYQTTYAKLYNRCKTFQQNQYNYLTGSDPGIMDVLSSEPSISLQLLKQIKPGSPLATQFMFQYKGQCNPNFVVEQAAIDTYLEGLSKELYDTNILTYEQYQLLVSTSYTNIQEYIYTLSNTVPYQQYLQIANVIYTSASSLLVPNVNTATPCGKVTYKPNNYKYSKQGAVSSSDRILRLNVETINKNLSQVEKGITYKQYPLANPICCVQPKNEGGNGGRPVLFSGTFIFGFTEIALLRGTPTIRSYSKSKSAFVINDIPIPIHTNNGDISYTVNVQKSGNDYLISVFYNVYVANPNDGLSFKADGDRIINFFNTYTTNLTIYQFGDVPLGKEGGQFAGLNFLAFAPTSNSPTLYPGTSLESGFASTADFNSHMILWDMTHVTSMRSMFDNAPMFNKPIGIWNTSNVTDMSYMFNNAYDFNQDIGLWDTSKVTDMSNMFTNTHSFDQDIGLWNVENVTKMSYMFFQASVFNNGGSTAIENWTAPLCTTFEGMFAMTPLFNQPITHLVNTSGILTCSLRSMFSGAEAFNQNIGNWNVTNVTSMESMFQNATAFNNDSSVDIQNWYAPLCTNFSYMFQYASQFNAPLTNLVNATSPSNVNCSYMFANSSLFNQDIGGWTLTNVTNMSYMFFQASAFNNGGSTTIENWSAPSCTDFSLMFSAATQFNQPLSYLVSATAQSINCSKMFENASIFNQDIGTWDVTNVINMSYMFSQASAFNNGGNPTIENWVAPFCTDFSLMFSAATKFNQPLTHLVSTSGVAGCIMTEMFYQATTFNQNIGSWDVSNVTSMEAMFQSATQFNNGGSPDIQTWSAPLCTNFKYMFSGASPVFFNQPLTNLVNTASTTDVNLVGMFESATLFNQDIGSWNLANVTNMRSMFQNATAFNNGGSPNIQNWSAPLCINFGYTFYNSTVFNQPLTNLVNTATTSSVDLSFMFSTTGTMMFNQNIGSWNVSNAFDMGSMFQNATAFNNGGSPDIQNWTASSCRYFTSMFSGATSFNQPLTNLVNPSFIFDYFGLSSMFSSATAFNQNIGSWNVSKAFTMQSMFAGATLFNNGGSPDIQNWTAPYCTSFSLMFSGATRFNQPLTNLIDTSNVTSCSTTSMFQNASAFNNGDNTTVSTITPLLSSYSNASPYTVTCPSASLTPNLTAGDVLYMSTSLISNNKAGNFIVQVATVPTATTFTITRPLGSNIAANNIYNISKINNIPNVTVSTASFVNLTRTLTCPGATFLSTVSAGDGLVIFFGGAQLITSIQTVVDDTNIIIANNWTGDVIAGGIKAISKSPFGTKPLTSWIMKKGTTTSSMFNGARAFNQNIGNWDTSKVSNMQNMFLNAIVFNNGDLNVMNHHPLAWNTSSVASISNIFNNARAFNQYIGNWNTSKVTATNNMFTGAYTFNNGQTTTLQTVNRYMINCTEIGTTTTTKVECVGAVFSYSLTVGDVVFVSTSAKCGAGTVTEIFDGASPPYINVTFIGVGSGSNGINLSKPTNIVGVTPSTSSYVNSTKTITCPGATFTVSISPGDVLFLYANGITYTPTVQQVVDDTTLIFTVGLGSDIASPNIKTLSYSQFGTNPLDWNLSANTSTLVMFQNCYLFNQYLNLTNTSIITTYNSIFNNAFEFNNGDYVNTALSPFPWIPTTSAYISSMFLTARSFNQSVNNFDVSQTTNLSAMFQSASNFNNGNVPLTWSAPLCTNFSQMFSGATNFNQLMDTLVNTTSVVSCTLANMLNGAQTFNQNLNTWNTAKVTSMSGMFLANGPSLANAMVFNNGQPSVQNISNANITLSTSTYNSTTFQLTCPGATFTSTTLAIGNVIVIRTSTVFFSSAITNIAATVLTLTTGTLGGSTITAGNMLSIQKQIPGTSPLTWNTANVTDMSNMFQYGPYFNQSLTTSGNIWNTSKVTNITSVFNGNSSTAYSLFNNGQIITGITAPMGWTFNVVPTSTNYRANCRLTTANKPASLA